MPISQVVSDEIWLRWTVEAERVSPLRMLGLRQGSVCRMDTYCLAREVLIHGPNVPPEVWKQALEGAELYRRPHPP